MVTDQDGQYTLFFSTAFLLKILYSIVEDETNWSFSYLGLDPFSDLISGSVLKGGPHLNTIVFFASPIVQNNFFKLILVGHISKKKCLFSFFFFFLLFLFIYNILTNKQISKTFIFQTIYVAMP